MKRLLAAAVAATMSATAMADISLTGDAEFSYDNDETNTTSTNKTDIEVNLALVGKSGDTKVLAEIGLDSSNAKDSNTVKTEDVYLTTKLGPVSFKGGNFDTSTTALLGEIDEGSRQFGKTKFSYTTNGIQFYIGNNGNQGSTINNNAYAGVVATVEGWKLQLKKNGASKTITGTTKTNENIALGVQGVAGPVGIRVEYKSADADKSDVLFANFTAKFDNINLGLAMLDAEADNLIGETDSSIFAMENGKAGGDSNIQLSASIAVDGTTYGAYIGKIGYTANTKDTDYYKVSAKRTLASGVTAAASYTDTDYVDNTKDNTNFSVDLSVKF